MLVLNKFASLFLISIITLVTGQCPPRAVTQPCACLEDGSGGITINCARINNTADVVNALARISASFNEIADQMNKTESPTTESPTTTTSPMTTTSPTTSETPPDEASSDASTTNPTTDSTTTDASPTTTPGTSPTTDPTTTIDPTSTETPPETTESSPTDESTTEESTPPIEQTDESASTTPRTTRQPQPRPQLRKLLVDFDNDSQVDIPSNFTSGLPFEEVKMTTLFNQPMQIDMDAFRDIGPVIRCLWLGDFNFQMNQPQSSVFDMMPSVPNVEDLLLCVDRVPRFAFAPLPKLKKLSIGADVDGTQPMEVEDGAFNDLDNLEQLSLKGVDRIRNETLRFKKSANPLKVSIKSKNLNASGFDDGSLEQFNRPTLLSFGAICPLDFLPEQVFKPFLDADPGNQVKVGRNLNESDERNQWMEAEPYRRRVNRGVEEQLLEAGKLVITRIVIIY